MPIRRLISRLLPGSVQDLLRTFVQMNRQMREARKLRRADPTLIIGARCAVADAKLGKAVMLADDVYLERAVLGDHTYIAAGTALMDATLGKFCSVGPNSFVGLPRHPATGFVSTHPIFYQAAPYRNMTFADVDAFATGIPTVVGNDVWIGATAMIMGGVRIGDGAIIGAGAVVTKDVPPYAIVAGVPARVIRTRFDAPLIEFLLKFQWWDKGDNWLKQNHLKFQDEREFVRAFASEGQAADSTVR